MLQEIIKQDTFDQEQTPAMLQLETGTASHSAFCFAMAVNHNNQMQFAVLGANDSTLKSFRAAISMGTSRLYFGEGQKEELHYVLGKKMNVNSKGQFEFINTQTVNRKKAIIAFSKELEEKYIVAIDEAPEMQVRDFLMAPPYGLPILEEWAKPIYEEMLTRNLLQPLNVYFDRNEFTSLSIAQVALKEEDCKEFLSEMIRSGKCQFPQEGTGEKINEINDLNEYLLEYSPVMLDKVTKLDEPLHQPMKEQALSHFDTYQRPLFPVQAHVATGAAKALQVQKGIIIQGEMSSGKSAIMTATVDGYFHLTGQKGYRTCVFVPPTLTEKWAKEEIRHLIPDAEVHLIKRTEDLIRIHQSWIQAGRPKPEKPTFFVISFTTMRGDSIKQMPLPYKQIALSKKSEEEVQRYYKNGYYCPDCGAKLRKKTSSIMVHQANGEQKEVCQYKDFTGSDLDSKTNKNSVCADCNSNIWSPKVKTKYASFKDWTKYENKLVQAIKEGNKPLQKQLELENRVKPYDAKQSGRAYRKVATVEYIRRKMKHFFDALIVDEVHELKSETAQGTALGSLAKVCKKVVAGTGTLFGGKASDVFYTLWRLFPQKMVKSGFEYSSLMEWNETYGNIERTYYHDGEVTSNIASRGAQGNLDKTKVVPGISPYVFTQFLMDTTINVRLKDVWPNPVELINVPTILVEMSEEQKQAYEHMKESFEKAIEAAKGTPDVGKLWLSYIRTGNSYPDNMNHYPNYHLDNAERELVWSNEEFRFDEDCIQPKEKKLQEILHTEISEGRPTIIYVSDTGSTVKERDIQPRLQKVAEQVPGAKVAILRTNTVTPPKRSAWLKEQVNSGVNVIICSQELVKVGLDLLATPTLIFYQLSFSLFTLNQAARRHWRIGQTKQCRTFYLGYRETFQEQMAQLIAQKNKAAEAMNGDATSDGLNAMLGDTGDLQTLLIQNIKSGNQLKGSTEEWTQAASEESKRVLANIGKVITPVFESIEIQFTNWVKTLPSTFDVSFMEDTKFVQKAVECIKEEKVPGVVVKQRKLEIDGNVEDIIRTLTTLNTDKRMLVQKQDIALWEELIVEVDTSQKKGKRKSKVIEGQFEFDLFG
ncbi:DEAD/DEAH box helicase [Bacillus cereus]|uniref:DEAD/DEAH box helicase n=1 Tax=Bacillus cereus TaxID=1396 RepID=A0AB34D047_BACCE|nr:DEAD/DEAH box helicase [Bacillus cereus]KAB2491117.1 DEAD/DEAH box helicase [Bacillus cereus]